jgi:predicted deacylase
VIQSLEILVDARMQKHQVKPDLRRLARLAIGLGPGFASGANCDIAVETRPGKEGQVIAQGSTDAPDGMSPRLGSHCGERFVRAEEPGRWHTAVEIGTRVYKDFVVGQLGHTPLRAPFDGILRGIVRDGTEVRAGVKLFEIDTRGRRAVWTGIDRRSRAIAEGVTNAIAAGRIATPAPLVRKLQLVK